ncbi:MULTISPECIES: nuclease-related domain-containing DEAD/DEAH box helicase [Pectobacterium]|uniref:nuclease-related domain-containing DEAD/DEAH box helicase n=1 Tax=Pectobacterium TaxID=122277 RepID=UPI0018DAAE28|nr:MULTISPECIES: AAA family ATPase [Pectobacterium]QPI41635.1 ATP-binding domain-containing protein [Pectobacterium aroidearum]
MARMLPELTREQLRGLKSQAEARFYEECRRQLPADVLVLYSINWIFRNDRGWLLEGEADFTIVMPQSGVFAVEVKGGGVSFDAVTGRWQSIDRNSTVHDIKDPFRQAAGERYALKDQLLGHALWRQWRGTRVTLGHAVMLPDIHDAQRLVAPDRQRPIIGIDTDIVALVPWLARLQAFWTQANEDPLGAQGVRLVEDILCSSVEVLPALRGVLDAAEQARIRLTTNQAKILRILGNHKRAIIAGGAGTGKTLIAVEKARQLAETAQSVLLLCYNRRLADALAVSVSDQPRITVLSFHQLCDRRIAEARQAAGVDLLAEAQAAFPGTGETHIFEVQMPFALARSNEILDTKYDALLVDEAQDFSDDYWFSIEELLSDPEQGVLYIFIDENQSLYRKHANLPVANEPYRLLANCRNTVPIHRAGYRFYTGAPIDDPDLPGNDITRTLVEDEGQQAIAISNIVRELLAGAVTPEDIAVLVAKRPKARLYGLLQAQRLPGGTSWAVEASGQRHSVLVDTVGRFKGLEASVVVLWVGDEVVEEELWEYLYVGATRAKSLLYVIGSARAMSVFA